MSFSSFSFEPSCLDIVYVYSHVYDLLVQGGPQGRLVIPTESPPKIKSLLTYLYNASY